MKQKKYEPKNRKIECQIINQFAAKNLLDVAIKDAIKQR